MYGVGKAGAVSVCVAVVDGLSQARQKPQDLELVVGAIAGRRLHRLLDPRHGAYRVKTKSWSFTPASWQAKHVSCCAASTGRPSTKRPKPQPPVCGQRALSFTITCTVVGAPGTAAGANSGEGTRFHASLTRTEPSGNGRRPAR